MNRFAIGDVVQVTGPTMTGNVGIVVSKDDRRGRILVRITDQIQNYFAVDDLVAFRSS